MSQDIRQEFKRDLAIALQLEERKLGRPLTATERWDVRRRIYAPYKRFFKKDKRTPLEIEREEFLNSLKRE